jgi:hypothetical protein
MNLRMSVPLLHTEITICTTKDIILKLNGTKADVNQSGGMYWRELASEPNKKHKSNIV